MQDQFLNVIDRDEAFRRFSEAAATGQPAGECVAIDEALRRVLAEDVVAQIDVPSFDRANYDGYALRAADTFGAREEEPRGLKLGKQVLATGVVPEEEVVEGKALVIATGGMVPRGADAVVMVEDTETEGDVLVVRRAITPGFGVAFAGSDVAMGETVLRAGVVLTSRETGVLAAMGVDPVPVVRRPVVAVLSTGNEIIPPDALMRPGLVHDSNARILADAILELGGQPLPMGIVPDDLNALRSRLNEALEQADAVLLSGGTSKGAGDLCYHVVAELGEPGIVAHGVALKPGKPICLAVHRHKPVVILPGFPTSAVFTFHEFMAPWIRRMAGRRQESRETVTARMAVKINSQVGRTEYVLVRLVPGDKHLSAFPMPGGSGSVTTFSLADGFVTIDRHEEIVASGTPVRVQLLGSQVETAELVVIGSHCVGLDYLLGVLQREGITTKFLAVGSTAGLEAARRGECDLAGIHLLDESTGQYNSPGLIAPLERIEGYGRLQGIVHRPGDVRFENRPAEEALREVVNQPDCMMVNRNRGSGTRILIDRLLAGSQPPGHAVQTKSHTAVAAAVAQGRADWGVAIEWVARRKGLGFLPLTHERYDFVIGAGRQDIAGVITLRKLLERPEVVAELTRRGLTLGDTPC